ncbi:hypothetical protein ACB092_11G025900 [Castanea dentata]
MLNYIPSNIYDLGNWKNIDTKLRDLLVERGPIRDNDIVFPRGDDIRHFSTIHYTRILSNGEKHDRKWLVYSKDMDQSKCTGQLCNEGTRDWKNISSKIRKHETTREHITNMNTWLDLEMRLSKNKTIHKNIQEQINKEKDHWKKNLVMQEHIRHIQNANEIKCKIIKKIKEAKYFSIILDCTPDASHQEQIPIKIVEHFVEFVKVDDTIGKGLFDEIINVINILELDINDIRKHQGVQKRLLDINSRAFYTPCGCHSLNLVLFIHRIYTLFSSSTKSWKILKDNVSGLTLKSLSQTRWENRIENALLQLAQTSEDPKIKSEADCLATYEIESFEFLLGMTICKNLQSKDMHIDVAIDQLKGLISYFNEYRENEFTSTNSSKKIALKMKIEPAFPEKHIIHRKKQFDENVHNEITLDEAISSIENRFEQFQIYEDIFGFLFNYTKLKSLDNDIAIVEISFSKLKLIKLYLRSTMSQERLSGLAILSIEKEMFEELEYKNLINQFASQKARKIDFK